MEFYELCKDLRDRYKSEANREVELQVLSQIHSAFFENGDKLPDEITLKLNIKPVLKNYGRVKYWKRMKDGMRFSDKRMGIFHFFETVVIFDMMAIVLEELELKHWDVKHFVQHSAWKFSVHVTFMKKCMQCDIADGSLSTDIEKYWKEIL